MAHLSSHNIYRIIRRSGYAPYSVHGAVGLNDWPSVSRGRWLARWLGPPSPATRHPLSPLSPHAALLHSLYPCSVPSSHFDLSLRHLLVGEFCVHSTQFNSSTHCALTAHTTADPLCLTSSLTDSPTSSLPLSRDLLPPLPSFLSSPSRSNVLFSSLSSLSCGVDG